MERSKIERCFSKSPKFYSCSQMAHEENLYYIRVSPMHRAHCRLGFSILHLATYNMNSDPGGTKGAAFLKGLYYCRVIKSDAKAVAALSGALAGTATAGINHRFSANKNL